MTKPELLVRFYEAQKRELLRYPETTIAQLVEVERLLSRARASLNNCDSSPVNQRTGYGTACPGDPVR